MGRAARDDASHRSLNSQRLLIDQMTAATTMVAAVVVFQEHCLAEAGVLLRLEGSPPLSPQESPATKHVLPIPDSVR